MTGRRCRHFAVFVLAAAAMAGPPPVAAAPQETINVEAGILSPVIVYVPAVAEAGAKPPLLVVLHGRGDTAASMAGIWNVLKDPKPLVALPEAPYPLLLTGDKGNSLGASWDSWSHDRTQWEQAAAKTTKYIVDTIRAVRKTHETGGVYLMGHSQGVTFAYLVAMQEPDLVRGVIAMAGYLEREVMPDETFARAAGKVAVFIGHGKRDAAVDPEVSRRAKTFLAERGFDVVLDEFDGGHNLTWEVTRRAQDWMMSLEQKRSGRALPARQGGSR